MSLASQYRKQFAWRDWDRALSACPIFPGQHVLDLGCGPGDLSRELSLRGAKVSGIDSNPDLLEIAQTSCSKECTFFNQNLSSVQMNPNSFDGLWCSFTAAYFTGFERIFSNWLGFLKKDAWVCVVDMDDLLGHEPLPPKIQEQIHQFYQHSLQSQNYDFKVGSKLQSILENAGFYTNSITLEDQELSFTGPASEEVLQAWSSRLDRMNGLKAFLKRDFLLFKNEFLECLSHKDHRSRCRVICCVGRKS